mmetsp:Transcript_2150/g.4509  ORF Transcript_2150/g.4509 Transcript_2150/m.4509 type:complete len:251 (-) Transcript_2150:3-755(-)
MPSVRRRGAPSSTSTARPSVPASSSASSSPSSTPPPAASPLGASSSASDSEVDLRSTAANAALRSSSSPSQVSSPTSSATSSSSSSSSSSASAVASCVPRSFPIAAAAALQASRTSSPTTPSNWLGNSPIFAVSLLVCRKRCSNFSMSVWLGSAFAVLAPAPSAPSSSIWPVAAKDSCSAILCATRRSSTAVSPSMTRSSSCLKRWTLYSPSSLASSSSSSPDPPGPPSPLPASIAAVHRDTAGRGKPLP